jgi:glucuronoarabinoxylan endo-1,4-beta-xylanase
MYPFHKQIKISILLFIVLFLTNCKKGTGDDKIPALSFVESTIPVAEVPFDTASVNVTVESSYVYIKIIADSVLEGESCISAVSPTYINSLDQAKTQTNIKIIFKQNINYARNRQKLTLKSSTGNLIQSIIITQKARSAVPINMTITPTTTYQTIAGFGGANTMWGTNYLTASQIKTAFGTDETDLGLTIFRVRLSSSSNDWQGLVSTLKEAKKYNVKILASPWSPPANLKSNNNIVGGYLLEGNYAAYATYLNDFAQYMAAQGVTVDAVSVQNEPDWSPTYESCDWSIDQMFNFVKNYGDSIRGAKLAAAESFHFNQDYTNKILNDPTAANNLDIVAGHIYGSGLAAYPLAVQKGKEVWMTEYLLNLNATTTWSTYGENAKWDETLNFMASVHEAMIDNWNAYIWWYIRRYYSFIGDGEQGTTLGEIQKRGYAISQFAKFVRPGYVRVDIQSGISTGYKTTAYMGDNKIVAVIINPLDGPVQTINLSIPQAITSAVAYSTSLSVNRQKETLTPQGNIVTFLLQPKAVTTIVINL